jgi:hypothetical protein
MARAIDSRWLNLLLVLVASLSLGTTCGDDDDDDSGDDDGDDDSGDDDTGDDEAAIRAILAEIAEGWTQRTVAGLDEKVMPHLSAAYDYAGLDRDGYRANAVEDLEEGPDLTIVEYQTTDEILVDGDGANAVLALTASGEIALPDFPDVLTGTMSMAPRFTFAREEGTWRVLAIASGPSASAFAYGPAESQPVLSEDFAITPAGQIAPGGSVSIAGTLTIDSLTETQVAMAEFALDWNPDAVNMVFHDADGDSLVRYDLGDAKGVTDLAATLPADGRPAGIAVPGDFVPGTDSVTANFAAWIGEVTEDGFEPVGGLIRAQGMPVSPFTSDAGCDPAPSAGVTGIWRLDLEGDAPELPHFLDLTIVGTETLASAIWAQPGGDGPPFPAPPLAGTLDETGFDLSFTHLDEICEPPATTTLTWTGTFSGTAIEDGSLEINRCEGAGITGIAFTGTKVTDRCDYLRDDGAEGDWIVSVDGEPDATWTLTFAPNEPVRTNYALVADGVDFIGLLHDNRLYAATTGGPGDVVAFLFDDGDGGTFLRFREGTEAVGTFTRTE